MIPHNEKLRIIGELQDRFVTERLGKGEKEALLARIRDMRSELGWDALPPYNSQEFCDWVEQRRNAIRYREQAP